MQNYDVDQDQDARSCRGIGLALLTSLALLAGCFSEPATESDPGSTSAAASSSTTQPETSETGDDTSTGRLSSTTLSPDSSSSGGWFATSTGLVGTGTETGTTGGNDTGEMTTGGMPGLCPDFMDEFDEPAVGPMWTTIEPGAVSQMNGRTVITLSAAANDLYPRRMLPWNVLDPEVGAAVAFRMRPVAPPDRFGTQLNLVVEGPPGNDVTLSLNRVDVLQYRVTSSDDGEVSVVDEVPADFPKDGWMQATIDDDEVLFEILDSSQNSVSIFAAVPLPFPIDASRVGFAANNWDVLPGPAALAVEAAEVECM